jgi:hypothetical protein
MLSKKSHQVKKWLKSLTMAKTDCIAEGMDYT